MDIVKIVNEDKDIQTALRLIRENTDTYAKSANSLTTIQRELNEISVNLKIAIGGVILSYAGINLGTTIAHRVPGNSVSFPRNSGILEYAEYIGVVTHCLYDHETNELHVTIDGRCELHMQPFFGQGKSQGGWTEVAAQGLLRFRVDPDYPLNVIRGDS